MSLRRIRQFALIGTVATIGLFAGGLKAEAGQLVAAPSDDTSFNQLITSGQFTEKFVTSARIGGRSTYEMAVLNAIDPVTFRQTVNSSGEFDWVSGRTETFSLSYDGTLLTYKLGNKTLSSSSFSGNASDIFLRTRSTSVGNSSVLLSNMTFTDRTGSLAISNLGSSGNDLDYLRIGKIKGAFTLTGQTTMNWTGTRPTQSALIAQFKVGNSVDVPEPATLGALAVVAGGVIVARRRRQQG